MAWKAGNGSGQKLVVEQLAHFGIGAGEQVELGHFVGLLQVALLQLEQELAVPGQERDFDGGMGNVGDVAHIKGKWPEPGPKVG